MIRLTHNLTPFCIRLTLMFGVAALAFAGTINLSTAKRPTSDNRRQVVHPDFAGSTVKSGIANSSLNVTSSGSATETKLVASDGAPGNNFGSAVAVSGNTAAVADNLSVYVFVRLNGIWTQQQKLSSVSHQYLAIDGNTLVAAGSNHLQVFVRNADTWTLQQSIDLGNFTFSVSVSGDTIVAGIPWDSEGCPSTSPGYRGAALVFVRNGGLWTQQQKLTAIDGQCGGNPNGLGISGVAPYVHPGDSFGDSVSISGDTILVGAGGAAMGANVEAGAAYVFGRNGSSWFEQQKLRSSSPSLLGHFGSAVAISHNSAVIGAPGDNGSLATPWQPGSAYAFGLSNGTWTPQQHFPAGTTPNCTYSFGRSVAVDGDTIVVGCNTDLPFHDPIPPVGSASWFKRSGSSWIQQPRLFASDGIQGDNFGNAVAVSGPTILVGALRDDTTGGPDTGSVYVFEDNADNVPPTLTVPGNITTNATSADGSVVQFVVTASDNLDPNPVVVSIPASGSLFPIGATTVRSTATDASGNSGSADFTVNVMDVTPTPDPCSPPDPVPLPLLPLPTRGLRRAMVMGQSHKLFEYGHLLYQPNAEILQHNPDAKPNLDIVVDTGSKWIRLWADWPFYQPSDPSPNFPFTNIVDLEHPCLLDGTKNPNYIEHDSRTKELIENLDKQIESARDKHLGIVLTTKGYPRWANYLAFLFDAKLQTLFNRDEGNYVVPNLDDLGENGSWGKWIEFLVKRYGLSQATRNIGPNGRGRYVDFVEVTNEPNLQMLPQRGMAEKVAKMFKTAQAIVRNNGNTLRLAGPGTSDVDHAGCQKDRDVKKKGTTNYAEFTEELLNQLRRIRFVADENFVWTHHNYRDVECDKKVVLRGKLSKEEREITNSAAWVRWMIVAGDSRYRWTGWPSGSPKVLITEGGARLDGLLKKYPNLKVKNNLQQQITNQQIKQRNLVETNFWRMAGLGEDRRLGEGIGMISSYLTYTDPVFDSGLFDFAGLCERPPGYTGSSPIWTDRACKTNKPCKSICTGQWGKKRKVHDLWKSLPSGP